MFSFEFRTKLKLMDVYLDFTTYSIIIVAIIVASVLQFLIGLENINGTVELYLKELPELI